VRDQPGIGAFVVTLGLDPASGEGMRALDAAELERLRATRRIVADRVRNIMELAVTLAPPVHQGVTGASGRPEPG
jgi:hypothetical protein